MKIFCLLPLFLLLAGCPKPQCEIGQTRCDGEVAEICDSALQWSYLADCALVSEQSPGDWVCLSGICEPTDEVE